MTFSPTARLFATMIGLSLTLAACANRDESTPSDSEDRATASAPAVDQTHSVATTGAAFLNGYQILPSGTEAVCATHAGVTTVMVGKMPSKSAASVIIDQQGVRSLSITDTEDTVEFTEHSVQVEVKRAEGATTISGEAEGTRVSGGQTQLLPMTFIINASCE